MKGPAPATSPRGRGSVDLDRRFARLWEDQRDELASRAAAAFRAAATRRDGLRAAAWELCRWLREDPDRGRVLLVDVCFADELARAGRDRLFAACAEFIHDTVPGPAGAPAGRAHADAITGAIWHRLAGAVRTGALDSLPGLVPELMYTIVLPCFGADAARAELRRGPADIARHERGEI